MRILGALLALLLSVPAQAQDLNKVRTLLEQALAELKPPPPPPVVTISTPEELDAVLATAAPGSTVLLSPTLIYPKNIVLKQSITLQSTVPTGRMDETTQLPQFSAGMTIEGTYITLIGVRVKHTNPLTDILILKGMHITLDRVQVLGDPVAGAKRCISANANGDVKIINSFIDYCFATYPGSDSQAVAAWDMGPGLVIKNNRLSAGSETILIGGADPIDETRNPVDITITDNTITKRPEWQAKLIGVKNTVELKNARKVVIENNDISQSWGGHGQDGYILVLTVRNQDGKCPTCNIEDVLIQNNRLSSGAAAINILGFDNNHPSGTMNNVRILNNTFTDLDFKKYTGSSRLILVSGGTKKVTIDGNVFNGVTYNSVVYLAGTLPQSFNDEFVLTNNTFPKSTYWIFGEGAAVGKVPNITPTWTRYVTNGTFANNVVTP